LSKSFIEKYATEDEKQKIFDNLYKKLKSRGVSDADAGKAVQEYMGQAKQFVHNKPRWGFTWNCYFPVGVGKYFQEEVKDKILETGIAKAWEGCIRYNPDELFQYDDPFLSTLNDALKGELRKDIPGDYAKRKREFIIKFVDIMLTMLLEDAYYRIRIKPRIKRLIKAFEDKPELLEYSPEEQAEIDRVYEKLVKGRDDRPD
jgi:predicted 3-demethylubiquinone-9 3-methyltransferase (glyoxalase superfamily)